MKALSREDKEVLALYEKVIAFAVTLTKDRDEAGTIILGAFLEHTLHDPEINDTPTMRIELCMLLGRLVMTFPGKQEGEKSE